jgi:hypothetical protein
MLSILHVLPGLAGQARDSASNGASTGLCSPILAGPCLVNDDTALGTVRAVGATPHYRRSLANHSSLACSRVGSRHALCDTNAVRWNVAIKRVLTRSLDLCRRSSCQACVRACTVHASTIDQLRAHRVNYSFRNYNFWDFDIYKTKCERVMSRMSVYSLYIASCIHWNSTCRSIL